MDNDAKNVSVENLKWYSSCEIEIEIEIEKAHFILLTLTRLKM